MKETSVEERLARLELNIARMMNLQLTVLNEFGVRAVFPGPRPSEVAANAYADDKMNDGAGYDDLRGVIYDAFRSGIVWAERKRNYE